MLKKNIKQIVKKHYSKIVTISGSGCCGNSCACSKKVANNKIAKSIGYSDDELGQTAEANLGLGCGNPTGMANITPGNVILDLGSGAGIDCFLAAKKTGSTGRVIGVDMTQTMIDQANNNAKKLNYQNVEFRLGDIEKLPVESDSIDVIISNCVINLAPDKSKVFNEAFRVLKKGGKIYNSDIVLLEDITDDIKNDEELIAGCVGGALQKDEYINIIKVAGFSVKVLSEDKEISKRQYEGIPLESIKIEAIKMDK
ncbi:MAG: arsenite methyltransferase [Patescibacteria group bacterium]|jgi:SAM-dependent methyltransferase